MDLSHLRVVARFFKLPETFQAVTFVEFRGNGIEWHTACSRECLPFGDTSTLDRSFVRDTVCSRTLRLLSALATVCAASGAASLPPPFRLFDLRLVFLKVEPTGRPA